MAIKLTGSVLQVGSNFGTELTEARFKFISGSSSLVGAATGSRAVVLSADGDSSGMRSLTGSGDAYFANFRASSEVSAGSLDISGDADIDGTLEADAYTVAGVALNEYIADTAGAMFTSNTESGLDVSYQDSDNTIDLALDAAQTIFTSVLNSSLTVGRDADNVVDFATDDVIILKTNGSERMRADNAGVDVTGAITATTTATFEGVVSGAAGTFDALAGTSLALQNGGITAAGAVGGATTVSGSGLFSMGSAYNAGVLDNIGAANIIGKLTVTAVSDLDGGIDVNASNFTVSADGAVAAAAAVSSSAALEGLSLDINGAASISSAGAIAGATSIDGSGDLTMGTITMSGFAVDADGDTALKSLKVDDGSTIGCDSDTDLMTLADGTLTVAGTLSCDTSFTIDAVTLNATELGFVDGVTAGTAAANKAVVLDASKDSTGMRSLTGSGDAYFAKLRSSGEVRADGAAVFGSTADIAGKLTVVGVSDLDGGIDVNASNFTVSADGAVAAAAAVSSSAALQGLSLNVNSAATISSAGAVSAANYSATGFGAFGGGYSSGGSGATISAAGAIQANGAVLLDSTLAVTGTVTAKGNMVIGSSAANTFACASQLTASNGLSVEGNSGPGGYALNVAEGVGGVRADEFVTYSDRNLKTNIQLLDGALDKVMMLEPTTYEKVSTGKNEIGFIAQDVAKVVPEICAIDASGEGRGIDYSRMSTLLVGALKAQQDQIAQLKEIVAKLQK